MDEWTQSFVGRTASIYDLLVDALGALVGLVLFWCIATRFKKPFAGGKAVDKEMAQSS
jgi:VanZ family protein